MTVDITKDCHCMHGVICHACHSRIEAETVAAIVAEVTARRDRATKGRDDISFGREKALDDLLDWLGDWKRGGHG